MEVILALAIGVMGGSGVWLLMRPRTYQVIIGLSLLSYAVNLFIFCMGRLRVGAPPVLEPGMVGDPANFDDPVPQALVLTAIVISFAMTAVSIVIAIRSRADNHSDHVDGSSAERDFQLAEQRRHEEARLATLAADTARARSAGEASPARDKGAGG